MRGCTLGISECALSMRGCKLWPLILQYIREATELKEKKDALSLVTVLEEPITPPKKLSYIRCAVIPQYVVHDHEQKP